MSNGQNRCGYVMTRHDLGEMYLPELDIANDDPNYVLRPGDLYERYERCGTPWDLSLRTAVCVICGPLDYSPDDEWTIDCNPLKHAQYYDGFSEMRSRLSANSRR